MTDPRLNDFEQTLMDTVANNGVPRIVTGDLLDEVRAFMGRFVVLPSDAAADLLALWVLHTHSFEAAHATPYLRIVSPAAESGKTLLLEILASVCPRGWHAINPSLAVLFRKVSADSPTLLLDEMDNYPLDDRLDALSVLNAGYKRGAKVPRCNEKGDLREFSVYCPKAYAGLDNRQLPDTLLSRSITIRMERMLASQKVSMWLAPDVAEPAEQLRRACATWAEQNVEALRGHRPDLLDLRARRAEVWWALLSIGELAGGDWQARARAAAGELGSGGDDTDDTSDHVRLLSDIRDAFGEQPVMFTKGLLSELNALDEAPWGARRRGEGLDARGLARMLRPFKIRPRTVGSGGDSAKGYHFEQFEDAFARWLPYPSRASQASHRSPHAERDATDPTDATDKSTAASEAADEEISAFERRLEGKRRAG